MPTPKIKLTKKQTELLKELGQGFSTELLVTDFPSARALERKGLIQVDRSERRLVPTGRAEHWEARLTDLGVTYKARQ